MWVICYTWNTYLCVNTIISCNLEQVKFKSKFQIKSFFFFSSSLHKSDLLAAKDGKHPISICSKKKKKKHLKLELPHNKCPWGFMPCPWGWGARSRALQLGDETLSYLIYAWLWQIYLLWELWQFTLLLLVDSTPTVDLRVIEWHVHTSSFLACHNISRNILYDRLCHAQWLKKTEVTQHVLSLLPFP